MVLSALIGREHPLEILDTRISRTIASHGGLVLITGEAGIGKTALVLDALDKARLRDVVVLSATCWDPKGSPGYWPWLQVVRSMQAATTVGEWEHARAAAGDALEFLLGNTPWSPPVTGQAHGAFRLYDAVARLLGTQSRSRPVIVVLEDLHWADPASVRLLAFVVRHSWFERLLVVATYRDVEVDAADHPLATLIHPLAATATSVVLTGLARHEVGVLMARTTGREPEPELVADVHRRTGGNPFFVEQMASLWRDGASITGIAPGVRDAIERRIAQLPALIVAILSSAAVLGTDFDAQLLAASTGIPAADVNGLLDQAVVARLVIPVGEGRFTFAHDLLQEALYAALDDDHRRRCHAAVVDAIERSLPLKGRVVSADLAGHAYRAIPHVESGDARAYLVAAAHEASNRLAFEEAARHYRQALELLPDHEASARAAIALDLGSALQRAGQLVDARRTFEDVVAAARGLDDPTLLAHAALGLHDLGISRRERADQQIALLDEAREKLATSTASNTLDVHLLAAASRARSHNQSFRNAAQELSACAVTLARSLDDDEALGQSLLARHDAIWEPGTATQRRALADELINVARRTEDRELESQGSLLRMVALIEQGDPRALDEQAAFFAMAERTRLPRHRFLALSRQGTIATLTGQFDNARAFIDEAFALGEQLGEVDRTGLWRGQTWTLAMARDDLDEAKAVVNAYRADGDLLGSVLGTSVAAKEGDVDLACRLLADVTVLAERLPRWFTPMLLVLEAQVAALSRQPARCQGAQASIAPFANEWAVVGAGVSVHGPMVLWSARVHAAQEQWNEAISGFTAAQHAADRLHARPWSIEARADLADALIARSSPNDADTTLRVLDDVERDSTDLGMLGTADRAHRARTRMVEHAVATRTPTLSNTANVFRLDGEVWTLSFAARTIHTPDAKGLRDIHVLLGQPGTDVHAVDLLAARAGPLVRAARGLGADVILDEKAKSRYRERLTQLDEEIERALAGSDDERAAELDRERQALIDELRRATGLGGRSRRLGDDIERARKTVTARIRDTLRRLDRYHPELAQHLRDSISTGATCRYQPTVDVRWKL